MNIKEAYERAESLKKNIEECSAVDFLVSQGLERGVFKNKEVVVRISTEYSERVIVISGWALRDIIAVQKEISQDEIDRLQPVIDMANAALRGIEK